MRVDLSQYSIEHEAQKEACQRDNISNSHQPFKSLRFVLKPTAFTLQESHMLLVRDYDQGI